MKPPRNQYGMPERENRYISPLLLVLIAASCAFLYVSFLNYGETVLQGELRLYGTDPYYNVRRIWLTVLQYPRLLEFDSYINYPEGSYINVPGGFHFLIATAVRVLLGHGPTLFEAGRMSVILTPFLGLLAVWMAAIVGTRWFSREVGALAAFLTATSPVMLHTSRAGRVDYHMLEPFFLMLMLYLFCRSCEGTTRKWTALAGLSIAASFSFVPAAIIFPALLLGFVVIKGTADAIRGRMDERFKAASTGALLWGLVFSLPLSMTSHFGRTGSFAVEPVSLFQPLMLLFALLACAVFFIAAQAAARRDMRIKYVIPAASGMAAIVLGLFFIPQVRSGIGFLFKGDPVYSTIRESESLFSFGVIGYLKNAPFLALLPVPVGWAAFKVKSTRSLPYEIALYWLLAASALGALQVRMFPLLMPVLFLLISDLALYVAGLLTQKMAAQKGVGLLLSFLVLALSAYPPLASYARAGTGRPDETTLFLGKVFDSLLWIRDHTPATSYLSDPARRPEYGVLAPWDIGHYMVFYAERPNIANPLGFGEHRKGIMNVSRFFAEDDEERAVAFLKQLGARYVLLNEQNILMHLAYLEREGGRSAGEYFSAMGSRLYLLDGLASNVQGANVEALGRFRLVYESKYVTRPMIKLDAQISAYKVFELVKGMRITGNAAPGAVVSASVPIRTDKGREFTYHTRTRANAKGKFELLLPYPTKDSPYTTGAVGPYTISSGGSDILLEVTEDEVSGGAKREIDLH